MGLFVSDLILSFIQNLSRSNEKAQLGERSFDFDGKKFPRAIPPREENDLQLLLGFNRANIKFTFYFKSILLKFSHLKPFRIEKYINLKNF